MVKKPNYEGWNEKDYQEEIDSLRKQKTYGLIWEKDKTKEVFDYYLNWEGIQNKEVFKEAEAKFPVLKEVKDKIITTDKYADYNVLIEGDNYHALATLNFTHEGQIDLIFIDPPYNTGNKDFKYNDVFVDKTDAYRHSKWLSFMEKRLALAKTLLNKDGLIFITIDDNEYAQLKVLCDEIFYENNHVATIVWEARKSVSNDAIVSQNHHYLLFYAKDKARLQKNKGRIRYLLDESKFSNPDNDPRGAWTADPIDAAQIRKNLSYPIKNPNTGEVFYPPKGRHWAVMEEEYLRLLKENRIIFGKNGKSKPQKKRFYNEVKEKGLTPTTWWDDAGTTTDGTNELENILGSKLFNNPKPVQLLKRIIHLGCEKDGNVLDFFAGSGTTGHAVLELNKEDGGSRKFILCTNNEANICTDVCYPRIEKVIKGYKALNGEKVGDLGGNLRYFKTDFVESAPTAKNKKKIVDKSTEMICLKENAFNLIKDGGQFKIFKNAKTYLGIVFESEAIDGFVKEAKKIDGKFNVYVFSLDDTVPEREFKELKGRVSLCPIPEAILHVYRRVFKDDNA